MLNKQTKKQKNTKGNIFKCPQCIPRSNQQHNNTIKEQPFAYTLGRARESPSAANSPGRFIIVLAWLFTAVRVCAGKHTLTFCPERRNKCIWFFGNYTHQCCKVTKYIYFALLNNTFEVIVLYLCISKFSINIWDPWTPGTEASVFWMCVGLMNMSCVFQFYWELNRRKAFQSTLGSVEYGQSAVSQGH